MKILAVDDDPIILDYLRCYLGEWGAHSLDLCSDPTEALKSIAEGAHYDCLLLDIVMPQMDGVDLCRALRRHPAAAEAHIIMLTAMGEKADIDRSFAAGATDYITKPINPLELRAKLNNADRLVDIRNQRLAIARNAQAEAAGHPQPATPAHGLHEPFAVVDVDFVIDAQALENYVAKLSKQALFGSSVFGFSLVGAAGIHAALSAYDFEALITDIAEAISDCLHPQQFLMSYVGNGSFLCVTEGGWVPDPRDMACYVHRMLKIMDPHNSRGEPIEVTLAHSSLKRLTWKSGQRAVDTLAEAHEMSENAAHRMWVERNDPAAWYESLMARA